VNYPNENAYTRVTEFKYLTGQRHDRTTVVAEYPCADGDPYYPVPRPENTELYQRYQALADTTTGVHFAGRLATYKYYNMDQVVAQALTVFSKLSKLAKVASFEDGLVRSRSVAVKFGSRQSVSSVEAAMLGETAKSAETA